MNKHLYALLLATGLSISAQAAPGDTTAVSAHPTTSFLQYGNFDHPVTFPNGSTNYRKINMKFTLGKETCPAGTQYCAQWDYTVRIFVMTPTDTFELGRFITPFAHSSYPNMPLNWKHDYVFDVTDFYPLLQNGAQMRIKYEGYSYGFTGSLNFDFIEGTPPRDVVSVHKLWDGSFAYGQSANPINDHTIANNIATPNTAIYGEMIHLISGHGGDQTENCAEFCSKWYQWKVNGTSLVQRNIWRDDCGYNWVYPQSGTWVYDRANWCPGDVVFPIVHKVPLITLPTGTFNTALEFQPYTTGDQTNPPSYTSASTMIFYREFNHLVDAGIEDVVAPTNKDLYFRSNPICGAIKVKIKNYGKNDLTSLTFNYGIDGNTSNTHNWTGTLASMETAIIELPTLPELQTITGNHDFDVFLSNANGTTDGEAANDSARTQFTAPPKWETGNYLIQMRTSSFTQNGNAAKWIVRDAAGNITHQKSSTVPNTTFVDTVHLENGCHSLEVIAEAGYGFRFLSAFTPGTFTVRRLDNNVSLALPKHNPGNGNLAGDFGRGFVQDFVVTNSTPLSMSAINNSINLSISPNPAKTQINVNIDGINPKEGTITITNTLGQTVLVKDKISTNQQINVEQLSEGVYHLKFEHPKGSKVEKLVISK